MARDMYLIKSMLDKAKSLVASQKYDAARDSLLALLIFYDKEAELSDVALPIAASFAEEAHVLLEEVLPKCNSEEDVGNLRASSRIRAITTSIVGWLTGQRSDVQK